jgi:protein ImuB
MRFTPLVALAGERALLLDVTGCAALFGGEAALLRRVLAALEREGVAASAVLAGAPAAALALARAGRSGLVVPPGGEADAVAPLDPAVLPIAPEVAAALARLGLRRIGDVRRQPRAPLARRFGAALLRALDEAAGEAVAPISPLPAPAEFRLAREFLEPLLTRPGIDAALDGLLRPLCAKLEATGRGARRLVLAAHRVDGAVQELAIGTAIAMRDPAHLARLFAGRLERLEPGFGFARLVLEAAVHEPMAGEQAGFVRGLAEREALARLFDRLGQRVECWRLAPVAAHWPAQEVRRVGPMEAVAAMPGWPRAPRPTRLLRRPVEIAAVALLPDAPPSLIRLGRAAHRVRAAEGPERLEPPWWQDGAARPARDYYRVELASGARLWLCRLGFGAEARWFVQGRL